MNRRGWAKSWWGEAAVTTVALLVLAVGFCLLHHDQDGMDGQSMSPDLCAGMVVSSLGLLLFAGALVNGRLLLEPVRSDYAVSLHIPDPPPKSPSLL